MILERVQPIASASLPANEAEVGPSGGVAFSPWRRSARLGLVLVVLYAVVRSLLDAMSRPFWYDELCTVVVARQAGVSAIWRAIEHAADGQPPAFYIMERVVSGAFTRELVGFRVLSILALCVTLVCVFMFVERRGGSVLALLCACTLFLTALLHPYSVEARPYALLVACIAFACVCYQRAPAFRWMLLMAVALALAQAIHYYAVIVIVLFGTAELAYFRQTHQFRRSVWLACSFGAMPLVIYWPLLKRFKEVYGSHFWSHPRLAVALASYGSFLNISFLLGLLVALVAIVGLGWPEKAPIRPSPDAPTSTAPSHERALIAGLLFLPLVMMIAAKLANGGFTDRYALPAVLAFPLTAGCILPRFGRRSITVVALFIVIAFVRQEASFWASERNHPGTWQSPVGTVESLLALAGNDSLPVAVSNVQDYFQLAYYSSASSKRRFVYLADTAASVKFLGSDSGDRQMLVLRSYYPLQVRDFRAFSSRHTSFLLYSGHKSRLDWWPDRLVRDGNLLQLRASRGESRLYLVTIRASVQ